MAQIRKYKSGGKFTYDGTDYVYDDIKDSLRDLAKSSDQRIGLQFDAILEALENGNDLSYNSTTNTLEGNVKWRDLNERQERRLEHNRSAFGNTLDNLFNSKVKQVGEAVSQLRSWRPPVKPIELVDISENLEITSKANAVYRQAEQRLKWAVDHAGDEINWHQNSKQRGERIKTYQKNEIQDLLTAFQNDSLTTDQKGQLESDFGITFSEPKDEVGTETGDADSITGRPDQKPPVDTVTGTGEKPLVNLTTGEDKRALGLSVEESSDETGDESSEALDYLQQYIDKLSTTNPDPEFEYVVDEKPRGFWVTPLVQVKAWGENDSIFFPTEILDYFDIHLKNLNEEGKISGSVYSLAELNKLRDLYKYMRSNKQFFGPVGRRYKQWFEESEIPEDIWASSVFKPNDAPIIERRFDPASGKIKWMIVSNNKADEDVPKMKKGGTVGSNNNGIEFNIKPDAILGILDLANSLWTTAKTADRQRAAIKENVSLPPSRVDLSAPQFNDQGITAAYNQRIKDILKPRYNQSSDPIINYSFQNIQSQEADKLRRERDLALSNLYGQHQDKLQELVQKQRVIDNQLALQNLKMTQQANQALANVDVSERLTKGQSLQRLIYEMRTKMANDAKRAEQYGTYVAQQNADATYIEKLRDAFATYTADFNQNIDKYGTDWQKYMETEHSEIAAKLRGEANIAAFEELYKSGIGRQSWFNWPLPDFTLKQKPNTKIETETIKVKRGGKMRSTGDQLMLDSDKATRKAIQKLDEYTYKIILKMLS